MTNKEVKQDKVKNEKPINELTLDEIMVYKITPQNEMEVSKRALELAKDLMCKVEHEDDFEAGCLLVVLANRMQFCSLTLVGLEEILKNQFNSFAARIRLKLGLDMLRGQCYVAEVNIGLGRKLDFDITMTSVDIVLRDTDGGVIVRFDGNEVTIENEDKVFYAFFDELELAEDFTGKVIDGEFDK